MDISISVTLGATSGKSAIAPLKMLVRDENGVQVGVGATNNGVGTIRVTDFYPLAAEGVKHTYRVFVWWESTDRDTQYVSSDYSTNLSVSVTATQGEDIIENTTEFAGGNGTELYPFEISDASQLFNMVNYPNSYYVLAGDIDLDNNRPANVSIELNFSSFEGSGHVVNNFNEAHGLFTRIEGSTVRNLTIVGKTISGSKRNLSNAGILADIISTREGSGDTLIENITIKDCSIIDINAGTDNINGGAGFIAGRVYAHVADITIKDCKVVDCTMITNKENGNFAAICGFVRKETEKDVDVKISFINCTTTNLSVSSSNAGISAAVVSPISNVMYLTNNKKDTYSSAVKRTVEFVYVDGKCIADSDELLEQFRVDLEKYNPGSVA